MIARTMVLLAGAASLAVSAAGTAQVSCPSFAVSSSAPRAGVLSFVLAPAPEGLTYTWYITTGTIVGGQGTPAIEVEAEVGSFVTASVDVGGLDDACQSFISASDEVFEPFE